MLETIKRPVYENSTIKMRNCSIIKKTKDDIMEKADVMEAIKYLQKYKTETNKIEVKATADGFPKKCYDTISSFSNKYGGIIIFGINENNDFSIE